MDQIVSPAIQKSVKFGVFEEVYPRQFLTLSLPNVTKGKFRPKFQISFSNILRNKWHHVKAEAESFHLNGYIIGFRPLDSKVRVTLQPPSNTLAVKGLTNRQVY